MYEELITRLEATRPENYTIPSTFVNDAQQVMLDAAAAIHQLQHHAADWERLAGHWHERCKELERQLREEKGLT